MSSMRAAVSPAPAATPSSPPREHQRPEPARPHARPRRGRGRRRSRNSRGWRPDELTDGRSDQRGDAHGFECAIEATGVPAAARTALSSLGHPSAKVLPTQLLASC